MPATRPPPPDQTRGLPAAVIFLLLAGVCAAAQLGKVAQGLLRIKAELGLSLPTIGWAVSLITLLGAIGGGVAGPLADRLGLRRVMIYGLWLMALAAAGASYSASGPSFMAWRSLEGLGYLAVVVAAPALISQLCHGPSRALALALWGGFVMLGFALIAALFALFSDLASWRTLFVANAVAMALLAVCAPYIIPRPCVSVANTDSVLADRAPLSATLRAYRDSAALRIGASFGCYAIASLMFIAFLPAFLHQRWPLSQRTVYLLASIVPLLSVAGNVGGGWALRRGFSAAKLALLGLASMLATALPMYWLHIGISSLSLSAAVLFAISNGIVAAALFAAVPTLLGAPSRQLLGFGLIAQFGSLGALLGPPLAGWTLAAGGWTSFPAGIGLACIVSMLALMPLTDSTQSTIN